MNQPSGRLRILHVDDDADTREIVSLSLMLTDDVELVQFGEGQRAISEGPAFGPDVVLLDHQMPEMSGPEVLRHLRQLPEIADVPVIFMTARARDEEVANMMSEGACAVIVKPFEPTELLPQIRSALSAEPVPAA